MALFDRDSRELLSAREGSLVRVHVDQPPILVKIEMRPLEHLRGDLGDLGGIVLRLVREGPGLIEREPVGGDQRHELGPEITPLEARIGWAVALDSEEKGDFLGREALLRQRTEGPARKLVGFEMRGAGIARQGYPIIAGGERTGEVTSGTKSPTLGKAIGLGYVASAHARVGTEIAVEIRDRRVPAVIVRTPFYKAAMPG